MEIESFDDVKVGLIFYLLGSDKPLIESLQPNPLVDTPEQISSVRRNKLTTFRRSKWLGFAGSN